MILLTFKNQGNKKSYGDQNHLSKMENMILEIKISHLKMLLFWGLYISTQHSLLILLLNITTANHHYHAQSIHNSYIGIPG